jgi:kynureninase
LTCEFQPEEDFALRLDREDSLAGFRSRFHMPRAADGRPLVYLAGNSLGLQPVGVAQAIQRELDDWARLAVDAHFKAASPWYSYHEPLREPAARLVGALPTEVVMMNGLTVNLHLMLVSFYRPQGPRNKILMEDCAFPSDTYAVQTQLRYHGQDPADALIVARADDGRSAVNTEDIERVLVERGHEIALVLLGGVNYFTGQLFDMQRITSLAARQGCVVGLDLAHAAGNVSLQLHDWKVDFAVWCSYKYLNSGPGAVAGCFVHERHADRADIPRFGGWWGNDPDRRFRMHLERSFEPRPGADGWQLSNPPVLSMAPIGVSLALFDEAGLPQLRAKSCKLTAYLQYWVDRSGAGWIELLTPREPRFRGCQLSMRVLDRPRELFRDLQKRGVVVDFRQPDVIRIAPVPLYNSYHDVWRCGQALEAWNGLQ